MDFMTQIERIVSQGPDAASESDRVFLRARLSYLSDEVKTAFGLDKEKKKTKE